MPFLRGRGCATRERAARRLSRMGGMHAHVERGCSWRPLYLPSKLRQGRGARGQHPLAAHHVLMVETSRRLLGLQLLNLSGVPRAKAPVTFAPRYAPQ